MLNKKLVFFFLLTIGLTYLYFYNLFPYDNIKTRIYLSYSISFLHTLKIDEFENNTIDKAYYNGHYYSDKSPFPSFFAVPILKILELFKLANKNYPESTLPRFIITLLLVTLPSLFSTYLILKINLLFCKDTFISILLTFAYSLGTLVFPYATLFYEHPIANNFLVFSLYLILSSSPKKPYKTKLILIGTFLGLSACCEYISFITSILLLSYLLIKTKNLSTVWLTILMFFILISSLLAYNYLTFGSIFSFGYKYEVFPLFKTSMSKGAWGITFPKFSSLLKTFLLPSRGLFFASPFLLFFFPGIFQMLKEDKKFKVLGIFFIAIIFVRSVIISSYWEPLGGFSPGPRHMISVIPFFVLPISFFLKKLLNQKKNSILFIFFTSIFISIFQVYITTAADPHIPQSFKYIIADFSIPMIKMNYGNGNLGKLFGLPHKISVAFPFLFILAFYSYLYFYSLKYANKKENCAIKNSLPGNKNKLNIKILSLVGLNIIICTTIIYILSTKLKENKLNWEQHYLRGSILLQGNILNHAEKELKKAITYNPNFYQPYFKMGVLFHKKGILQNSIKYFKKSIQIEPYVPEPRIALSASYLQLKDYNKAEEEVEKALELFPNSKILQNLISDINNMKANKDKNN